MSDNLIYKDSINKLYSSIVWTHKIQRTYLEHLELRRKIISIIEIIATGCSSVATMTCSALNQNLGTMISSTFVLLSLILSEILKQIETAKDISDFKTSSSKLFDMRNRMQLMSDDIIAGKLSDETIRVKMEYLNEEYVSIQKDLKTIPNYIVEIAERKLKERHDEEVDNELL